MSKRSAGDGFSASHAAVVGRYLYRPQSDSWWWSDAMFRIHGFEPGSVVPTTELVMSHIHPGDRGAAWESREAVIDQHEPFSFLHRITTADNRERIVIAAGHLKHDDTGEPVIYGHLIDLTDVRQEAVAAAVDPAVVDFVEHRAVIEQAKGVLMQLYSVDEATAFALVRAFSADTNMKVRDVATLLTTAARTNATPAKGRTPSAHDLLGQLHTDRPAEPSAESDRQAPVG